MLEINRSGQLTIPAFIAISELLCYNLLYVGDKQNTTFARCRSSYNILLRKEGRKCLFNDALNTFYLLLYCVGQMVKDHSDGKKENFRVTIFLISSKGCFVCIIPDRVAHTIGCGTSDVVLWLF